MLNYMASYPALGDIGQEYILEEQYKTLFGYPNGKVNLSLSSEVPGTSRPFILQNQIYSQEIPITPPILDASGSTSIGGTPYNYQYSTLYPYLEKYTEVQLSNNYLSKSSQATGSGALTWWFIESGKTDNRENQLKYNILSPGVPNNLDPNGNYTPTLYIAKDANSDKKEYGFGNGNYPWTYNVNSGIVLFTGSYKYSGTGTPDNNTPDSNDIITFTFWRYNGTFGTPSATTYWQAITTPINGIGYGALSVENSSTGSIYTQNILANDTTANVNLYTNLTTGSLSIGSTGTNCQINSKTTFISNFDIFNPNQSKTATISYLDGSALSFSNPQSNAGFYFTNTNGNDNLVTFTTTGSTFNTDLQINSDLYVSNSNVRLYSSNLYCGGEIRCQKLLANDDETLLEQLLYTNLGSTGKLTIGSTGTNSTFNSALVVGGTATFNNGATFNNLVHLKKTTCMYDLITPFTNYTSFYTSGNASVIYAGFAGSSIQFYCRTAGNVDVQTFYSFATANTSVVPFVASSTATFNGQATFNAGAVFNTVLPTTTITASSANELVNYTTLTSQGYTTLSAVQSQGYTTLSAVQSQGYTTLSAVQGNDNTFTLTNTFTGNLVSTTGLIVEDSSLQFNFNKGAKYINSYLIESGELTFQPYFGGCSYKFICTNASNSENKSIYFKFDKTTIDTALEVGGTATFNTYVPECSVGATSGNQLTNKTYVDSKIGGVTTNQILNFSPTEVTNIKKSIIYRKNTTITSSSILASLDNPPTIQQVYTFGKKINNLWVATGYGNNINFAYSYDGITWDTIYSNPFGTEGNGFDVAWNGQLWVAGGNGNSINFAYSYDGITWYASGSKPFSTTGQVYGVAWNGQLWVAGGNGNSKNFAWSEDGVTWNASGSTLFTLVYGVAWNGKLWVAGGYGNSKNFAWSEDGKNWSNSTTTIAGSTSTPFGTSGSVNRVAWNGQLWVAGGNGNSKNFAWSEDGQNWYASGSIPFGTSGDVNRVVWNGQLWVACGIGSGTNFAWSEDGITWNISTSKPFGTGTVYGLAWNGSLWVAVGGGNCTMAWSINGKNWTESTSKPFSNNNVRGVAFNSARPNTITFTNNTTGSVTGNTITLNSGDQLDVVCDSYYNTGFTNCSISIDA